MKKSQFLQSIKEVLAEEKPGLWANIRAKRARGEKPAHKNSKAHKDAVAAGEKINAMSEQAEWPDEVPSRHGDIIFKLVKVMPDRAKYSLIDAETGKEFELGGRVYKKLEQLKADAEDTIKPKRGKISIQLETSDPQDGKAAPYGSGFKKATRESNFKHSKNPVNQLIPQLDKISSELAALDQKKYQKAISYISDAILDLVQK